MRILFSLVVFVGWLSSSAVQAAVEFTRPQAGNIAYVVGELLALDHYRQVKFNDQISAMFLTNYLNTLDYSHMVFLQDDVDEIQKRFNDKLDDFTKRHDASPAFVVFDRYLQRLDERNQFVQKILKEPFDFTTDERFTPARDKLPWPKDNAEAETIWRARIKYEVLQGRLSKEKPEETITNVSKRYTRLLKTMRDFEVEDILSIYLTSLGHAYDPHSDYMSPTEAENFDINSVKLSLSGIGALLRQSDEYTRIESLVPGGPAALSKQLRPKDKIVAVSQGDGEAIDVIGMRLNKVVDLIRGKRGTEVRLTIVPAKEGEGGAKKVIRLTRDEIKLDEQHAKATIIERPISATEHVRLGVITLTQFYEHCAHDVDQLLGRLKKENVDGVVLDLRHNGGGLLPEAVELAGLFIRQGPVVQVQDSLGHKTVLPDEDPRVSYEGPLIVAVSHLSASASEIVAAALQDYGRALIVGNQTTHGKGTVQQLWDLDRFLRGSVEKPGKMKFTVSTFYRISGGTTQLHGVTPEIKLPSVLDYMELGEASLPNCLAVEPIAALDYDHLNEVVQYVPELAKKSAERLSHNLDYTYVNEDIEFYKKQKLDKSVSLNESKRVHEKDELKLKADARKKERAQRKPSDDKVFELNLDIVDHGKPLAPFVSKKTKDDGVAIAANDSASDGTAADDEDAEPETPSAIDPEMAEVVNILADYTKVMAKPGEKLATQKAPEKAIAQ